MKFNRIVLSLAGIALMALMISQSSACITGKVTGGGHGKLPYPESTGIPGGSFGFNVMYEEGMTAPKGELEYVDHATGMNVHGHTMTDMWVSADHIMAWFTGECTIDGIPGFTFRVDVVDNGEPGKDDHFKIQLFDGSGRIYLAGNTILCGNIQIHVKP